MIVGEQVKGCYHISIGVFSCVLMQVNWGMID